MAIDPRIQCWWEKGQWPIDRGEEMSSAHFEDIRKRIWLLGWPGAGFHDLTQYGKTLGDGTKTAYTAANWVGSWSEYDPGGLTIFFEDAFGRQDLYTNWVEMNEWSLNANPPIRSDGRLNAAFWRLLPNPNVYAHWNYNGGKPAIGADGRWFVNYHAARILEGCTPLLPYTSKTKAWKWLPQQLDPYKQIPPVQFADGTILDRHQAVEIGKAHITGWLGTHWERSLESDDCAPKPRRLTEYILDGGEPNSNGDEQPDSTCEQSNQCALDLKIGTAYQDRVIKAIESATRYVKKVDDDYVANWLWAQTKYHWTLSEYYAEGQIAYITSETDEDLYVCIAGNTATADNKPGSGADWEDYWITPPYQPEYIRGQPEYAMMGCYSGAGPDDSWSWYWACNDSAYELCLRDLGKNESVYPAWSASHGPYYVGDVIQYGDTCYTCIKGHDPSVPRLNIANTYVRSVLWGEVTQFDWWWDTSYPAVPLWLYKKGPPPPAEWPAPRGCWRRTWKHSAGRVSGMMWPGEMGDPPGYEPMRFIVTKTAYNNIAEADRKWYVVKDVERLWLVAYTSAHEALIAARHDPIETRNIQYYDEKEGRNKIAEHPLYEMHHDIVNDLRNALLQLHLTDDLGVTCSTCSWRHLGEITGAEASLQAYAEGRIAAMQIRNPGAGFPTENPLAEWCVGDAGHEPGRQGIMVSVDSADAGGGVYYESTCDWVPFYIDIYHTEGGLEAVNITTALYRISYAGQPIEVPEPNTVYDGCLMGFEDKTIFANPDDPAKIAYARLKFADADTWIDELGYKHYYFDCLILPFPPAPSATHPAWPAKEAGEYFDFIGPPGPPYGVTKIRLWNRTNWITILPKAGINLRLIFDSDWDKVPASVFEEDRTNAIIIPA